MWNGKRGRAADGAFPRLCCPPLRERERKIAIPPSGEKGRGMLYKAGERKKVKKGFSYLLFGRGGSLANASFFAPLLQWSPKKGWVPSHRRRGKKKLDTLVLSCILSSSPPLFFAGNWGTTPDLFPLPYRRRP